MQSVPDLVHRFSLTGYKAREDINQGDVLDRLAVSQSFWSEEDGPGKKRKQNKTNGHDFWFVCPRH